MSIEPLFTATATATGGKTDIPKPATIRKSRTFGSKEMGGPGRPATATPEHLFAAGYAACFGGALDFVGRQHKKDAGKASVTCDVSNRQARQRAASASR